MQECERRTKKANANGGQKRQDFTVARLRCESFAKIGPFLPRTAQNFEGDDSDFSKRSLHAGQPFIPFFYWFKCRDFSFKNTVVSMVT
jgi:hypothetical protein